jgi:quercetin dioxygenase-like cupin family protein
MKITPEKLDWEFGKVNGFCGKTLLDKENGGLKLVKVLPSADYPIHQHPNKTEFIYVLEGNPIITIGEKEYISEKGDFFTLPKSVNHSIKNKNNTNECLLIVGSIKE